MSRYAAVRKAVDELRKYGKYLGNHGSHQYFSFYDGEKNHYYDVDYLGSEPIKIDKLNVMFSRESVIDCNIPDTSYVDDVQFGGF